MDTWIRYKVLRYYLGNDLDIFNSTFFVRLFGNTEIYPCRETFHEEFKASLLTHEMVALDQEVMQNTNISEEAKADCAKEATDSAKAFLESFFKFPKIKRILSTVNEILSIGRKLTVV